MSSVVEIRLTDEAASGSSGFSPFSLLSHDIITLSGIVLQHEIVDIGLT